MTQTKDQEIARLKEHLAKTRVHAKASNNKLRNVRRAAREYRRAQNFVMAEEWADWKGEAESLRRENRDLRTENIGLKASAAKTRRETLEDVAMSADGVARLIASMGGNPLAMSKFAESLRRDALIPPAESEVKP